MKFKILNWLLVCLIIFQISSPTSVYANTETEALQITATSAILIDQDTGRVLYEKNADEQMYPASMTKIMTSLLCIENIKADEIVTVGSEINFTPLDSSRAGLEVGQSISGKNLIRSVIIPSGNEASNTVAMEVIKRKTDQSDITYPDAELQFAELMNERAVSLGATNTNFVNPSGYHDDNHYSTARDLALITTEAMKSDIIRTVSAEVNYSGPSVESGATPNMTIVEHSWYTRNQLINPRNSYYYKYATGLKTGFTSLAGECLLATATKDGTNLLLVMFNSVDPQRWIDSKNLFDYGFNNYSNVILQEDDSIIQEVVIDNPIKGSAEYLNVLANDSATALLTKDEADQYVHTIEYNPAFLSDTYTETGSPQLKAPIIAGEEIGTIQYKLGDELLYEGSVISAIDVNQRTLLTDLQFHYEQFKKFIFSWRIVPVSAATLFASIYIVRGLRKSRQRRRKKVRYKSKYNNFKTRY